LIGGEAFNTFSSCLLLAFSRTSATDRTNVINEAGLTPVNGLVIRKLQRMKVPKAVTTPVLD